MEKSELETLKMRILGEIRRDTNGAVVGTMADMNQGEEVYVNFGVTAPKIKNTAKEYAPNHLLAIELFNTKIRELKLAAIYIDDADQITKEQMYDWQKSFDSLEIAEHSATMLFYKPAFCLDVSLEWASMDDKFTQKAAFLMASKRAKMHYDESEIEQYQKMFNAALSVIHHRKNGHSVQSAEIFLAAIGNKSDNIKKKLLNLIEINALGESGCEIFWQLS